MQNSDFRTVPTTENSRLCKSSAKLCVTTNKEVEKCKWFQQAALNYGIQPIIACVDRTSKYECLQAVQNNIADMVVIDSNMLYAASR